MTNPKITAYTHKVDTFMSKYPTLTQYDTLGAEGKCPKLKELEKTTGYPAAWFFAASFVLLSGFVTIIGGAKLLVDIVGFVYPAYMSFKSMDSGSAALANGDDTQWLTYWVVFSFLTILESVFGFLVMLIPFYFWIKIGILVWMWYPTTRGAQTIYENILRPMAIPYLEKANDGKSE